MNPVLREQLETADLELIEARKTLRTRDYVLSLMESLDRQLAEKRRELLLLAAQLESEKQDIQVLEAYTVEALVSAILDKKEKQLQKETAEYWQMKLYHDKCQETITSLQVRLSELEEQLVWLADCEEVYEQRLHRRDQLIAQLETSESIQFLAVSNTLATQRRLQKSIIDTIHNGRMVLSALYELLYSLEGDAEYPLEKTAVLAQQRLQLFDQGFLDISGHFSFPLQDSLQEKMGFDPVLIHESSSELAHQSAQLQQLRQQVRARIYWLYQQLEAVQLNSKGLQAEQGWLIRQIWQSLKLG